MSGSYHGIQQALGTVDRGQNVVTPLAVTGTTTYNSVVMNATGMMENFSYQCGVATGTPTGTFNVYVSNDPRAADSVLWANAVWTLVQSVPFTAGVTTTGSQTSTFVVVQNGARFSYCRWLNASSSGSVLAFGCGVSV